MRRLATDIYFGKDLGFRVKLHARGASHISLIGNEGMASDLFVSSTSRFFELFALDLIELLLFLRLLHKSGRFIEIQKKNSH